MACFANQRCIIKHDGREGRTLILPSRFLFGEFVIMRKILFAVNNMNINGIKTSLLHILNSLDSEKYSIDLLLFEKSGALLNSIPTNVDVISIDGFATIKEMAYLSFGNAAIHLIKNKRFIDLFWYCLFSLRSHLLNDIGILYKYLFKKIPSLSKEYDYAISYFGPLDVLSYFVLYKVPAKKRDQWIHFDVNMVNFNLIFAKKYFPKFDRIIAVSEKAKYALNGILPALNIKSYILPSPVESIIKLSQVDTVHYKHGKLQIVTIGRLAPQKGPDIALAVANELKKYGLKFEWHFVGGGILFDSLQEQILSSHLDDCFFLEGEQINPYKFLPDADLYVQPSRHEGYGLTIQEAKAVNLPIICTDFAGADEQIINGISGLIVECNIKDITTAIIDLSSHPEKRKLFSSNLCTYTSLTSNTHRFQDLFPEDLNV